MIEFLRLRYDPPESSTEGNINFLKQLQIIAIASLLLAANSTAWAKEPKAPRSFQEARKLIPKIYTGHGETFYCGCKYNKRDVQEEGCAYKSRGQYRLNWEMLVSATALGAHRAEWKGEHPLCGTKHKSRSCLEKANLKYRAIMGNPYNLYPAILRVNVRRQNFAFTVVKPTAADLVKSKTKDCHLQVKNKIAFAGPDILGEIARTYLYMQASYPEIPLLTKQQTKQMYYWSAQNTPNEWECERSKRIREATGLLNQFAEVYYNQIKGLNIML